MDLILWRHADADPGGFDLDRQLTAKGHRQAKRMAQWLRQRLPSKFEVVASPAVRAQQTAAALGSQIRTAKELAPGAKVQAILAAAGWPEAKETIIIVGHQPDLGRAAAFLLSGKQAEWHLEKGGFWWFASAAPVIVKAALSPDLL
jgi:phosphohistidine phosphatase